ncbi:autotransporter domain-containing protein [Reyranella soli]|uniref:Autotransporter n=1 Tax=Reyranella soli TaxID=1230389 RepID=A0A512NA54_9HYPH|nr:autotransporter domain-containing protein [Reyranella soli]GEP55860.1 autotransporter [Reyranella soli]
MRQARQYGLSAAFALATGSLIHAAPAGAQTATACVTAACTTTQQNQLTSLLSPFTTLVGTNALSASFQTQTSLYQSPTYNQQLQAAANANLAAVLTQIWQPYNNPSSLDANVLAALGNSSVMTAVNNAFQVPNISSQATFLKSYTGFTTYQSFGQSGPYNLANIDPHPFQTNAVIWGNQWTNATVPCPAGTAAANCPAAVQTANWESDSAKSTSGSFPSAHMMGSSLAALTYAVMMPEAYQDLMVSAQLFGLSRNFIGVHYPTDIIGGRIAAYYTMVQVLANNQSFVTGDYQALLQSTAATLRGAIAGGVPVPYATCATNVATCIANGTFPTAAQFTAASQAYAALTNYGLPTTGPTNLAPVVPTNAELLIASRFPYLSASQRRDVLASTELPSGAPLDDGSGWERLNLFAAAGGYGAFTSNVTVTMDASKGGFHAIDMWSNNISGPGSLTKLGTGILVLGGNNTYTGGTIVGGGTLALSGTLIGNLTTLPGATFVTGGGYAVSPGATLNNAGTFQSVNASLLNQGTIVNNGTMLSSISNAGSFANNGVVTGSIVNAGLLSGTGTIVGNVANFGALAPGNSIGTMTVNGSLAQNGGTYQVETSAVGQSDRINVTGTPGTASLNGTVSVVGASGVQAPRTTYTILNATGGVAGTFASANSLYPFLLPSLSYDANNVYLTLQVGGFAAAGQTATQQTVGRVLDANVFTATGDFATVLGTMATNTQSPALAQATLTSLSGQNYSSFSSTLVQGALLFMNNFANQTSGGGSPASNRVALAEACDVACDVSPPAAWGAWGGALGGLGTIGANAGTGAVTYSVGGFAAGLDRVVAPGLSVGVTAGYTAGTQWTSGFSGNGTTDTFLAGLYGGYRQDKVYADAVLGYAYSYNQMWRQIFIPGLQPRTAQGSAGANQWYGQIEGGYRFDIGTPADAAVTPFARLQGYTGAMNGFTENGAQSLNLTVAGQTTNSLRSVLGAQLGAAIDLGWREKLALQLRLGWSHEYADTARPVTATLAGAPLMPFTTYGISPTRDGAVVGFSANTAIADGTSAYLRYEGNIAGQDSAHALTAGVRMSW